jgi:hypothetical protein
MYKATVLSGEKKYTAKGKTVVEAFTNLEIDELLTRKPLKTVLIAERVGGKKKERLLGMGHIRRFAAHEITRKSWAALFDGVI